MGNKVLNSSVSGTDKIRAYSHCASNSYTSGSVTILIINLFQNSTFVTLPTGFQYSPLDQYSVTPPTPLDITSPFVS